MSSFSSSTPAIIHSIHDAGWCKHQHPSTSLMHDAEQFQPSQQQLCTTSSVMPTGVRHPINLLVFRFACLIRSDTHTCTCAFLGYPVYILLTSLPLYHTSVPYLCTLPLYPTSVPYLSSLPPYPTSLPTNLHYPPILPTYTSHLHYPPTIYPPTTSAP